MPIRKLLKNKIWKLYRTQDRCAYELGIDSGILSRIINCTKDPTEDQTIVLCDHLGMSEKDINYKS